MIKRRAPGAIPVGFLCLVATCIAVGTASTSAARSDQQEPTPPFPTLPPTQPFPTLPPDIPTPAPYTATPTRVVTRTRTPTPTRTSTPTRTPTKGSATATSMVPPQWLIYLPELLQSGSAGEPDLLVGSGATGRGPAPRP